VYFSPGRINLLGEHTDYNGGLVLPMAIGLGTRFEVSRRADAIFRVHSEAFSETVELTAARLAAGPRGHWSDYLLGVLAAFPGDWPEQGMDLRLRSNLPAGRGLSSSASLTLGFAGVLADLGGGTFDGLALARIAQAAENDFVGLACGILDPFAVAMGQAGKLLVLHCGTLEWEPVPFPAERLRVLLADTGVSRSLAGSCYNERRTECERAAARVGRPLVALRPPDFEPGTPLAQDPLLLRRARHVASEHARVRDAVAALKAGDARRFGTLMNESHRSLRDDYEVSCPELDEMAGLLQGMAGVHGAKMTGAGFGGAVVALVEADRLDETRAAVPVAYGARTGRQSRLLACEPAAGFYRVA
jgi:galactokinase